MAGDCRAIPVSWLREHYHYDPFTGRITYRAGRGRRIGEEVGWINHDGYRVLKVSYQGRRLQITAHCLAWAIYYGEHPEIEVDHRDLNRQNNRIRNLRLGTRSQNLANRGVIERDLPKGVCRTRSKSKPFQAQIEVGGRKEYLGTFACPQAAHAAYAARAKEAFGDFARVA